MSTPGPELYSPAQRRTRHGKRLGRPRGDGRVLAVLNRSTWTPFAVVAERLGTTEMNARQIIYRAHVRGLIERGSWRQGWRIRRTS